MTYVIRLPRAQVVALRKESVDRNHLYGAYGVDFAEVALRKESVDRNECFEWIKAQYPVALRKESVDRNNDIFRNLLNRRLSLSARRAWIEMLQ